MVVEMPRDSRRPYEGVEISDMWRERVESTGGTWRVINDLDNLDGIF